MRQLIKRILREETRKDLSPVIKELLNKSIGPKYKRIICTFDAIPPWKTVTNSEDYQIMVSVIGGPGSKRWPNTQDKVRERDAIVNDVWHAVYNFIGLSTDVFLRNVKSCDEVMSEGLRDTSWQNDDGDKVTLIDLLDATEDIPVKNIPIDKIKSKLLTWDEDDKEVSKIEKADLQYPILIFVDGNNKIISIIDGHHRAQKAVKNKLKTIKAKLIPINSLPKNMRKVFSHLSKQEEKEGAGAYDAPAFEMEPDHTTFKHEDKEIAEYSRTLKNARQQGVGLRFPKSAIKSNPSRFRPYNR